MKHIAADLHSRSITFCTVDTRGKELDLKTVATSEKMVVDYLSTIKGQKQLTCEEGPLAEWMLNISHDKVDRMLICDPRENPKVYKGNSNDNVDARNLAELLRMGSLVEVRHPDSKKRQEFRELMNLYSKIVKDITRTKNRLKFSFKMKGIMCSGNKVYNEQNQGTYLKKIVKNRTTKRAVNIHWDQLNLLKTQKEYVYKEIRKDSKNFKEIKEFLRTPGVGLITAATFSAFIFNPFRFSKKSRLWGYCGLSLIENDSGKDLDPRREWKRQKKVLRRLTYKGNRRLKSALKSAAQVACHMCKDNELKAKYLELRNRGLDDTSAILTISRSLSCKLWGIWKRIEREKNNKTS